MTVTHWLIKRTDQGGGYVNKGNRKKSYTKSKSTARVFSSYEAAKAACCPGNEVPVAWVV